MDSKALTREELRQRAERIAEQDMPNEQPLSVEEARTLIHELNVHQVELEIQNEELRATRQHAKNMRDSYSQLFHKAPIGYLVLDREGQIHKVNDTFCTMTGYTSDKLLYKSFASLVLSPDDELFRIRFKAVFKHPEQKSMELRITRQRGGYFFARIAASVGEKSGQLLLTVADMTAQRQAEDSVRKTEAMYQVIFEGSSSGILAVNNETRKALYANPEFCRMFGYSQGEVTRLEVLDLHPKELHEFIKADFRAMVQGEKNTTSEVLCLRKDGTTFYADITAHRAVIGGNEHTVAFFTDVTERCRTEQQLREREELYRDLFERMGQGVVYQDAEGRITEANPSAQRILGLTLDQMQGRTSVDPRWRSIREDGSSLPGEEHPAMIALRTGQTVQGAIMGVFHPGDQHTRWILVDAIPEFQAGSEKPFRVFSTFTDITERKRAERYRAMGRDILQILNRPGGFNEAIARVLNVLKNETHVQVAGIRLKEGDDFPFFCHEGFSDEFLKLENSLIRRNEDGCVCKDADGNVSLERTCGMVLCGRTPGNSSLTKGGSCWTNDSHDILALPPELDPRLKPRNQCVHEGYASVALIPIRNSSGIVGLIHLGDKRKGSFSLETIELLENVGADIGDALLRKKSALAMRESEERFKTLFQQSPVSKIIHDMETGEIIDANETAYTSYGFTSVEQLRKNDFWAEPPYSKNEALAWIHKAAKEGRQRFEWMSRKISGETFWEDIWLSKIKIDGKERILFAGIDITERKRAEEQLSTFAAIMEQSDDIMVVKDLDLRVRATNSAFAKASGHASVQDMIGKTDAEIFGVSPDSEPVRSYMADERLAQTLPPGEYIMREEEVHTASGQIRHVLTKKYPIFDKQGRLIGTGNVSTDFTKRKKAEEALKELNRQLERSSQQALELAERAEAANVAKSQFLANASHELRTPMNAVLGCVPLLEATPLNEEQRSFVNIIYDAGKKLLTLIDDLLDFSKIEAGKMKVVATDFDLRALLEDFASMIAVQAHGKQLEFVCRIAPGIRSALRGDASRLRQILTNLVGNAIKFTEHGEVVLSVEQENDASATSDHGLAGSEAGDFCRFRFSIKDTGIGISQDKMDVLFQSFSQVDGSNTRNYGGTGLGLAISRQLAHLMGGDITVTSEVGKGTEFVLTLSLEKRKAEYSLSPPASLAGVRVLVLDDNTTSRDTLRRTLEAWGMQVLEAERGEEAKALIEKALETGCPVQLALFDTTLPGEDVLTIARSVHADGRFKNIPLALMVSFGKRGDAQLFSEAGVMAYLTKPIRNTELQQALVMLLSGKRMKQPITRHTLRELHKKGRVLVVEDNVSNQLAIKLILQRLGIQADIAGNGQEALETLERERYDLVFMDIQMPVMDGLEATKRIRSQESGVRSQKSSDGPPEEGTANEEPARGVRLPIIALTAHAMAGDAERFLKEGLDDYIAKPIEIEKLVKLLDRWLPEQQAGQATEKPADVQSARLLPKETAPELLLSFDYVAVMKRYLNDAGIVRQVVEHFVDSLPALLAELDTSVANANMEEARRLVHSLKGSSANVGAEIIRKIVTQMEKVLHNNDLSSANLLLAKLLAEGRRFMAAARETMT